MFLKKRKSSKELPLFFDKSGVRMQGGGSFVQRNCLCFFWQIWGTYARGDFLFKGIVFGFWDFFVQIQGNFSKEIFFVFEKFWFGGTYPGVGKCLDHKKKRLIFLQIFVDKAHLHWYPVCDYY